MQKKKLQKGDKHFIVFFEDNTIERLDTIEKLFRHDIRLIIKRTFVKYSSGKGFYEYYKNQILDENRRMVRNSSFWWHHVKCKIKRDEHWAPVVKGNSSKSVFLEMEVVDRLGEKNILRYGMANKDVFKRIGKELEILNRVGTHQGLIEILKLQKEIEKRR